MARMTLERADGHKGFLIAASVLLLLLAAAGAGAWWMMDRVQDEMAARRSRKAAVERTNVALPASDVAPVEPPSERK